MAANSDWKIREKQYDALFEQNPQAVFLFDRTGQVVSVNHSGVVTMGRTEQDLLQQTLLSLVRESDRNRARHHFQQAIQGEKVVMEVELLCHDQATEQQVTLIPVYDQAEVQGVFGIVHEAACQIAERKQAEALIQRMAYHDALTELLNRAAFAEDLARALQNQAETGGNVVVLLLDLDGFKNINDTLGHSTGDVLLKAVAERLRAYLGEGETLYRIGGDEFVLLNPHVLYTLDAMRIASRLTNAFKLPWSLQNGAFHITASIGIAIAPLHGTDAETLLRFADLAMYDAKEKGKNNCQLFNDQLKEKMAKRITMERALRKALQQKEFTLFYQPLVNTKTGQVMGAEALVRWNRPGYGMVAPAEFIPVAEETGMIVPLGEWIFRNACLQAKTWEERGETGLRIHVNLSSRQFQEPKFLHKLRTILEETGATPELIGLEITESLLMTNMEYTVNTLLELRKMGFLVSIDDFGTGYSSLGYLKQLPVDQLKIDKTFVLDLLKDPDDEKIIDTILMLAKTLGLSVVAEGVETENHLRVLREKDCDEVQGYYYSKPIPAHEFETKFLGGGDMSSLAP